MKTLNAVAAVLSLLIAGVAFAEDTRPTNPNAISVEIFGKGFLYTVQYDRAVSEDVFAGFGYGSVSADNQDGTSANITANMFPVYAGYYFVRDQGSPFVEIGASVLANGNNIKGLKTNIGGLTFSDSQVLPFFGIGYEERTDNGFLFRVTAYGISGQNVKPWVGATFGYAF